MKFGTGTVAHAAVGGLMPPRFALSIVIVAIGLSAPVHAAVAARGGEVGKSAPLFNGTDTRGEAFSLQRALDAPGRAAVVLVFAEIDAEASRREINDLNKIEREWRKVGVELVHIGLGATREQLKTFARERGIPWKAVVDRRRAIGKKYGVEAVPHLVIVARDRTVGFISTELSAERYQQVRTALSTITGVAAPWGASGGGSTLLHFAHNYTFGRPPSDPGSSVRWQPLAMLVGQASNAYVSMMSAETYEEYEQALLDGEYEIANVGPGIAHRILDRYEPMVHLERRNKSSYRGILFARSDRGITKVGQLRGKTLALVSPGSTSGGLFPFAELLQVGLEPEVDVHLLWVGNHSAVAKAVKRGRADAGGCYDDCRATAWRDAETRDAETRLIGFTDDIPAEVIVVRRDIPEESRGRIRQVLLAPETWKSLLGHISGSEEPISGVSEVKEAVLRKLTKSLRGVPEAMAKAQEIARKREEELARKRESWLLRQ